MTETTTPAHLANQPETEPETKPNFVQRFSNSHPRIAKIAAITGAVTSVLGAVSIAATLRSNKDDLDSAADNFQDGAHDLASSVSPTDTDR